MIDVVKDFPNQIKDALKLAGAFNPSPVEDDILNVTVVGMGGSGIGGDVTYAITKDEMAVPFQVVKGYDLPNYVATNSLVICSSFSGNTEETISAYEQAKDNDARVCVITSGGKLKALAEQNHDDLIILPDHISSPRANIGYSAIHLLTALEKYGLISDSFKLEAENLAFLLENNQNLIRNKARDIAQSIKGKLLIMYGGDRLEAALLRNVQQINENGKQFCHHNVFPELNHNEIIGWEYPDLFMKHAEFVFFQTDFDHARVRSRMKICEDILHDKGIEITHIKAKGASFLEQAFYIIHLFDFVSCELAEINEVDPTSIAAIDYLKTELSKL